jgi:uncharacterized membrane protein YwzB
MHYTYSVQVTLGYNMASYLSKYYSTRSSAIYIFARLTLGYNMASYLSKYYSTRSSAIYIFARLDTITASFFGIS